jgi:hypothetical protein
MQETEVHTQSEQQQQTTQPGGSVADVANEAQAQDALTEDDIAFVTSALKLGGSLLNLLETDPLAAAAELESAAQFLRQIASSGAQSVSQPSQAQQAQEWPGARPEALEEMIQSAVERALAEKMKQTLASPRSLQGPPPSARRLADLIE